jgi:hypothetical protein
MAIAAMIAPIPKNKPPTIAPTANKSAPATSLSEIAAALIVSKKLQK